MSPRLVLASPTRYLTPDGSPTGLASWGGSLTIRAYLQKFRCCIRDEMARGRPKREAIEAARLARPRPVLMPGTLAALGFVPMMLSTGVAAEVQRPLATVVFFGMLCDTMLTMLALPVLYLLFGKGPAAQGDATSPARPYPARHPSELVEDARPSRPTES